MNIKNILVNYLTDDKKIYLSIFIYRFFWESCRKNVTHKYKILHYYYRKTNQQQWKKSTGNSLQKLNIVSRTWYETVKNIQSVRISLATCVSVSVYKKGRN